MPKQLTVRGVSDELSQRLSRLSRGTGRSINATALRILEEAIGVDARRRKLERYATWSAEDLADFERALSDQRVSVDGLWK